MLKRYLLFTYPKLVPSGGWNDFVSDFDSEEEARSHREMYYPSFWAHLVDTKTKEPESSGRRVTGDLALVLRCWA